ncbi:MAG: hypothetical protein ACRETW_01850 [Stenotrophobium sp.]
MAAPANNSAAPAENTEKIRFALIGPVLHFDIGTKAFLNHSLKHRSASRKMVFLLPVGTIQAGAKKTTTPLCIQAVPGQINPRFRSTDIFQNLGIRSLRTPQFLIHKPPAPAGDVDYLVCFNLLIFQQYYVYTHLSTPLPGERVPTRRLLEEQWGESGFHGLPVAVHAGERQAGRHPKPATSAKVGTPPHAPAPVLLRKNSASQAGGVQLFNFRQSW